MKKGSLILIVRDDDGVVAHQKRLVVDDIDAAIAHAEAFEGEEEGTPGADDTPKPDITRGGRPSSPGAEFEAATAAAAKSPAKKAAKRSSAKKRR